MQLSRMHPPRLTVYRWARPYPSRSTGSTCCFPMIWATGATPGILPPHTSLQKKNGSLTPYKKHTTVVSPQRLTSSYVRDAEERRLFEASQVWTPHPLPPALLTCLSSPLIKVYICFYLIRSTLYGLAYGLYFKVQIHIFHFF